VDPLREAHRQWVEHGWAEAADGMSVVTSVMRAQQVLMSRVEAVLKPHGLSFARFELLRLLAFSKTGELPLSVVGRLLQVHPTSVTSAVDRLERDGHVIRRPHPQDRRAVLASLTELGRKVVEAATVDLNAEVFSDPELGSARLRRAAEDLARLT
jgi:DNA-binding MarR family transcriptional regulator